MFELEAKKRQSHGQTAPGKTLSQKIDEASKGRSDAKAAKSANVNRQYVSDAKAIKETAPDLFAEVASGNKTIRAIRAKNFGFHPLEHSMECCCTFVY